MFLYNKSSSSSPEIQSSVKEGSDQSLDLDNVRQPLLVQLPVEGSSGERDRGVGKSKQGDNLRDSG